MSIYKKIKYKLKSLLTKKIIIPSYEFKRAEIDIYRKFYDLKVLVETGTFMGDTVDYFRDKFEHVYSVELSIELAEKSIKRFQSNSNVQIIHGDSGFVLKGLIEQINQPILFWLDGHYSSEFFVGEEFIRTAKGKTNTPIIDELEIILKHRLKHVILIDDARLFVGEHDYPTINKLKEMIQEFNKNYTLSTKNDIIYILPSGESIK